VYVYKTAHTNDIEVTSKQFYSTQSYKLGRAGADPASKVRGGGDFCNICKSSLIPGLLL